MEQNMRLFSSRYVDSFLFSSLIKKFWRLQILSFFFILIFFQPCNAENKNGVSPNTISLPSGPGSIEGLGNAFQPMLNTGTAKYDIKIALPPGTAGHSPKLSLFYESGNGDGPVGVGWSYGPGSVHRQTDRGIPRYVDSSNGMDDDYDGEIDELDEIDRFIGLEDEELVSLADGTYRARIEGTFIRYRRIGMHWEAHLKNGSKLEFGLTVQARVTDETGTKIYKWLLEKSTDTNGNVIEFYYSNFPGSNNQKYLQEVRYGSGNSPWSAFYFAHFIYEDRSDWRKDYRSGFLIKTAQRLSQIDIGIQGVVPDQCTEGDWNRDGTTDALIRRYALSYDQDHHRSFLTSVTQYGANGISYLPPVSFIYSTFNPAPVVSAAGSLITTNTAPTTVMDSDLVDLVDLNRDGLPDLLQTDFYGGGHRYYLNLGVTSEAGSTEIEWDEGHAVKSPDGLATMLHLVDKKVHLADMNGNGISDLVHTTYLDIYPENVYYYLSQGDGSWSERKQMTTRDTAPPAPFSNDDVKTSDLDFDKRMDVVQSTDAGYAIWFNLEEGRYSRKVQTSGASYQGDVIRFSQTAVHLADLNGDRLNDVIRIRPTHIIYCANMGHGRFDTAVEIPISDTVLTDDANGLLNRAQIKDINGDGLLDLVIDRARTNELWYWLNLGTDTLSEKHIITGMPSAFGEHMVTRWADINGNGTTDLIYADSFAASRLMALDIGELSGGSEHPNLLVGIDNGMGGYTQMAYRSSTDYYIQAREAGQPWSVTIPFPVAVISQVTTTTGLNLDRVPGIDQYIKIYSYRDGFYEDREKAFRGFAQVTVTEIGDTTSPTRVTTHDFFTGGSDGVDNDGDGQIDEISPQWYREEGALKGLVKSVAVRAENGFLFSEEKNDWLVRNLFFSADNSEVRFAYNQEVQKLIFEGTATPETLRTTFVYDNFGNVTEERNYGALSITGDEAFTLTEYINDTDLWIIGLSQRQYVTNDNLQMFSETLNYYDGPDYTGLSHGQVTAGNLTRQEGWVEGSTYVNLLRNAYDSHGNITGILDPNGNQRTIAYDTTLHTYPVQENIEVGGGNPDLTVTAAYNPGLGVITSSIGFNGHQTIYGYDTFGRLTSIVRPEDSAAFPTLSYNYTMSDPIKGLLYDYDADGLLTLVAGPAVPSAVTTRAREISGQPGTFDTVGYVDGLGRKLATVEEGETGFIVKETVLFNGQGSVHSTFLPYRTLSQDYTPPVHGSPAVETRYDATGREILAINPLDANSVVTSRSTTYAPLTNTTIDENGNSQDFFYDGLARLAEVHEHNQGETYITQYSYDPLDNLTQITDAQNNVKTIEYDGFSRKTAINDPDRGRMEYTYDAAGNILQTIDNKGQAIVYTHDGANRILARDYLDGKPFTPDVTYHYDSASPDYPGAENTKGRLSWVEDLSGGAFYSYDPRGNTIWSVKRIIDAGHSENFFFFNEYDTMNRVILTTYPDGDQITYTYNRRSLLDTVPGIVTDLNYFPSGQLESIIFQNSLATTFAHDPRNRITGLVTDATTPAGSPIQDLSYTFDGVNNIMAITDNRPVAPTASENATQAFMYDDFDRLIRAEGPGYGAINFEYDRIGNMTFKSSPGLPNPQNIDDALVNLGLITSGGTAGTSERGVRLPGEPPGPHAISGTQSGLTFDYDDNGNMIDHNGDIYTWDFQDRLVRTTTSDTTADYVYDFNSRRVIKRSLTSGHLKTVYYPGSNFEIRDGRPVKYIFNGSHRIARVEGRLTTDEETGLQVLHFGTGWNFFSLELEPDDPLVDSVLAPMDGKYTEIWTFDPAAQEYIGRIPGQGSNDLMELHSGPGYIIYVTEPVVLVIPGTRPIQNIGLEDGWNLIACPSDMPVKLLEGLSSIAGQYEAVWTFDNSTDAWQNFVLRQPQFLNNLDTLHPGKAYWIKMSAPGQLSFQQQPAKIFFYHPDHLGSSSVITDEQATVVERSEFYPFGMLRYEESSDFDSAYKYTGKELDKQTGLMYYGARYYMGYLGRFITVDPFYAENPNAKASDLNPFAGLKIPQNLNLYQYTLNNPIRLIDLQGLSPEEPDGPKKFYNSADEAGKAAIQYGRLQLNDPLNSNAALGESDTHEHGGHIVKDYKTGKYRFSYTRGGSDNVSVQTTYKLGQEEIVGFWHLHVQKSHGETFSARDLTEQKKFDQIISKNLRRSRRAYEHYEFLGTPSGKILIRESLASKKVKGKKKYLGRGTVSKRVGKKWKTEIIKDFWRVKASWSVKK